MIKKMISILVISIVSIFFLNINAYSKSTFKNEPKTFQKIPSYTKITGNWILVKKEYFHTGPMNAKIEFADFNEYYKANSFPDYLSIKTNKIEVLFYSKKTKQYEKSTICNKTKEIEFYKNFFSFGEGILRFRYFYGNYGIRVYSNCYYVRIAKLPKQGSTKPIPLQKLNYKLPIKETIYENNMSWGNLHDGLILGIKLDTNAIKKSKNLLLKYCLKNVSKKAIKLRRYSGKPSKVYLNVIILNEKNEPVYSSFNSDCTVDFLTLKPKSEIDSVIELFPKKFNKYGSVIHQYRKSKFIVGVPEIDRINFENAKKGEYKIMAYYCFCFPNTNWEKVWWGVIKSKFVSFAIK